MIVSVETADRYVDAAVRAALDGGDALHDALDQLPAAIYVTDAEGRITFYNKASAAFAGRDPRVGEDSWCVTWKLYTLEGAFLPHEECPMAVAVKEQRPVRGLQAFAERPDGTRVRFQPFPTPLFDDDGTFVGAINVLIDLSGRSDFLRGQADRARRLGRSTFDDRARDALMALAEEYDEQASRAESIH